MQRHFDFCKFYLDMVPILAWVGRNLDKLFLNVPCFSCHVTSVWMCQGVSHVDQWNGRHEMTDYDVMYFSVQINPDSGLMKINLHCPLHVWCQIMWQSCIFSTRLSWRLHARYHIWNNFHSSRYPLPSRTSTTKQQKSSKRSGKTEKDRHWLTPTCTFHPPPLIDRWLPDAIPISIHLWNNPYAHQPPP